MAYVTSAYRYGFELGFEEGLIKGLLKSIEVLLDVKFGEVGITLMPTMREIKDSTHLRAILDTIKTAATLDEVRAFAEQGE